MKIRYIFLLLSLVSINNIFCMKKNIKVDVLIEGFNTAAASGNIEKLKELLRLGVDINCKNIYGATALFGACYNGYEDSVKFLIESGIDVNAANDNNDIALSGVILYGYVDIIKMLIEAGSNVNHIDKNGLPPLYFSVIKGYVAPNPEIVELLLTNGANINFKINSGSFCGKSIYQVAKHFNYSSILEIILNHISSLKKSLYKSIEEINLENFKFYVKKIGSIKVVDKNNNNLLHFICERFDSNLSEEDIDKLLKFFALIITIDSNLINQKNNFGLNPIEFSLKNNKLGIFKIFLEKK